MSTIKTVDIERYLEKQFVLAFRAIFEIDDRFVYNEDDKKTGVLITPEYPSYDGTDASPQKIPHLTVTEINYTFTRDTTIGNNSASLYTDETGLAIGEVKYTSIPYSLVIFCSAEEYQAKDMANKVIGYAMHTWEALFDSLGLNIRTATKGPARLMTQYPLKIFQVPVAINGVASWTGINRYEDSSQLTNIIRRIGEFEITLQASLLNP